MAEYKTTIGLYRIHGQSADDPVCPGDDWKLVCATANAAGLLFWFWERQEAPKPRVQGGGAVRR